MISVERHIGYRDNCISCNSNEDILKIRIGFHKNALTGIYLCKECAGKLYDKLSLKKK